MPDPRDDNTFRDICLCAGKGVGTKLGENKAWQRMRCKVRIQVSNRWKVGKWLKCVLLHRSNRTIWVSVIIARCKWRCSLQMETRIADNFTKMGGRGEMLISTPHSHS
ncbi:hypothetical protein POVWA2_008080 [Plasmodium ovale wallikeri]|uniref:Uncharacterized protein n=1 Tax=Plasmodium ovale wallikeri TaxID=864142 RepID=A0A1A8YKT3_PLAOA|nr:hypothetical protein POVWA2_008080 [Plasmodium ovale wallikeri]